MDSCRWDMEKMKVIDSVAGEMSAELPVLHMEPEMDYVPDAADYEAPLYKTSARAGTLSTTGKCSEEGRWGSAVSVLVSHHCSWESDPYQCVVSWFCGHLVEEVKSFLELSGIIQC